MEITDYVSYPIALALKKAGFDWPCEAFYEHIDGKMWLSVDGKEDWNSGVDYSAPTLWQAQKWLREKKGIAINVIAHDGGAYDYDIVFLPNAVDCNYPIDRATFSRTYEEALSEGIASVLELIEKEGE